MTTAHPSLAQPGVPLPAHAAVDLHGREPLGLRDWCDVVGGIAFVTAIGLLCMDVGGALLAGQRGWAPIIAWEAVWLVAAMLCAPLMPSGIVHDISWRSTWEGLKLDWPELAYASVVFISYVVLLGGMRLSAGPVGLAIAVGTAEEFIFRVLLLGWLVSKVSPPVALTLSSVVFGLAHLQELSVVGLASVVPQTAGGFVLGAVYLRTRNPIAPIIAHAYWDLPIFLALGAGVAGGSTAGGMPPLVQLAPWLGFIVYGLWLVRHGVPTAGRVAPLGSIARSAA